MSAEASSSHEEFLTVLSKRIRAVKKKVSLIKENAEKKSRNSEQQQQVDALPGYEFALSQLEKLKEVSLKMFLCHLRYFMVFLLQLLILQQEQEQKQEKQNIAAKSRLVVNCFQLSKILSGASNRTLLLQDASLHLSPVDLDALQVRKLFLCLLLL